jgi:hypothetical protein
VNQINEKIETFIVLATVDSLELANRISAAFEDIGIPILLEHVDSKDDLEGAAYRISTHSQFSENGARIVDNFMNAHDTRKIISSKDSASSN